MSQHFLRPTEQTSINKYSSQPMTKQVQVLYTLTHTHIYILKLYKFVTAQTWLDLQAAVQGSHVAATVTHMISTFT
jgi:hypothetical protein